MKSFNQLEGLVRALGRANVINKFSTAYLHSAEIIHSDWIKIIMANLIRVLVFRIMELCFAEICLYIGSQLGPTLWVRGLLFYGDWLPTYILASLAKSFEPSTELRSAGSTQVVGNARQRRLCGWPICGWCSPSTTFATATTTSVTRLGYFLD